MSPDGGAFVSGTLGVFTAAYLTILAVESQPRNFRGSEFSTREVVDH